MTDSPHFRIDQLAEGVYAAIATREGSAIANAGIVNLGDRTLVYDTFMTAEAARDLRTAALELTGRDPEVIFNSHYHNDHIWGNQAFHRNAEIHSTRRTLELIQTEGREEIRWASDTATKSLADYEQQAAAAKDGHEREELLLWAAYFRALAKSIPDLQVRLPDRTFDKQLTLPGPVREVEFIEYRGAHTGSDAIMLLPELGILFGADLIFVQSHPFLAECDVTTTLKVLDDLAATEAKTFVPGHGPAGTVRDLRLYANYIRACLEIAGRLAASGEATPERIREEKAPAEFSDWTLRRFFAINLQVLCKQLIKPDGKPGA